MWVSLQSGWMLAGLCGTVPGAGRDRALSLRTVAVRGADQAAGRGADRHGPLAAVLIPAGPGGSHAGQSGLSCSLRSG